nr:4-hydroxy-tetrahydrodipicolinate synthase [Candidatus Formimonas warabiya]
MTVNFGSVITAMVTPFKENGKVNFAQAQKLAQFLMENGSDGVVVSGTTGEASTMSFGEKADLFTAVKEAVDGKGLVIAGTGDNETKTSVELSEIATKIGVDGLLLVVPYYNKPPQEGLYQHFKAVASTTPLPIMLYNIPSRTGSNLLPETVQRLAQMDNIIAIKEATGAMDQVSELRKRLGDTFAIYSGDDSLTLPMLALGCSGVVSVVAHLVGKKIKIMIESFQAGNIQQALNIHLELFDLFRGMFITTNPIPVKTALNLMGWDLGGFRLPMVAVSEKERSFIEKLLKQYQLI